MAYLQGYSRESSVMSDTLEYVPPQQTTFPGGFEVIPEEVEITRTASGVQLGASQRLADGALASWRSGTAPTASLTSGLSLSTRSSDVDLKEFLVQRGRHPLQGLHKAAAQGDRIGIMNIMKQLGPDAPLNELDANGCTPLMYAVMTESRLAIEMLLNFSTQREEVDSEGRTAVHYAAFFGKHKSLKFLVDTAADWTPRDIYGRTPLHWACSSKSTRCLAVLLKHAQTVMGNINPADSEGMTPLHCAAQFGRHRNIMLLSEAGCDLTAVDIEEKTALHWTAGNRDSSCVQTLLDAYPPLLNRQDISGSTLLHMAASNGSIHIVDTLLGMAGIDLDMRDNAERTPLHCCSQGGHTEIVQLLLSFGALDSCFDFQGYTALHYAVQSNSTATISAFSQLSNMSHLPDANEGKTPLMIAAQSASTPIVKALLESPSAVKAINHTDIEGKTALHMACECGSEECATALLSHGADPNLQDSMSQSPLVTVCIAGHTTCIHPLIAGGASAQRVDSEGHSPLLKAVLYGQSAAVQSLILAGVHLDTQDTAGTTALHMAAISGAGIILNMLLENGANPNIQDASGFTALHMAAVQGHTDCVTALTNHRANVNQTDFSDERLTPLDCALENGHSECAEELKARGAVTMSTIREMAAICIQTVFRGFRARRLRARLNVQTKAETVIAAHVRTFLQKKRYMELKKRHYAACRIQALFRGYQERVIFRVKKAEKLETEKKLKMMEDFAELVLRHQNLQKPFPSKSPGIVSSKDRLGKERQSRLEAAMKMREIYEEKQRRWEAFRAAEERRRIDKARQAEFDRLTGVIAQSRARREYTRAMFSQSLCVRSHHHAAIIIQRAFRAIQTQRWWRERVRARLETERKVRLNNAARKIQRTWRKYWQYKMYKATHFKSVLTSQVVSVSDPKTLGSREGDPSYKRGISITGYPRRKVHQTLPGGFRVPKPGLSSPTLYPVSFLLSLPTQNKERHTVSPSKQGTRQRSLTSPNFKVLPQISSRGALPELLTRVQLLRKAKPSTAPAGFHLPQIVPNS